jgi:hypothetical protein
MSFGFIDIWQKKGFNKVSNTEISDISLLKKILD